MRHLGLRRLKATFPLGLIWSGCHSALPPFVMSGTGIGFQISDLVVLEHIVLSPAQSSNALNLIRSPDTAPDCFEQS